MSRYQGCRYHRIPHAPVRPTHRHSAHWHHEWIDVAGGVCAQAQLPAVDPGLEGMGRSAAGDFFRWSAGGRTWQAPRIPDHRRTQLPPVLWNLSPVRGESAFLWQDASPVAMDGTDYRCA